MGHRAESTPNPKSTFELGFSEKFQVTRIGASTRARLNTAGAFPSGTLGVDYNAGNRTFLNRNMPHLKTQYAASHGKIL